MSGEPRPSPDAEVVEVDAPARPGDAFFSVDVETDGPIPGPYSMLSFAIAFAGRVRGSTFEPPATLGDDVFYAELRPISETFDAEALAISGLDRATLAREGREPEEAMTSAAAWIRERARDDAPVLVAYPLGFDWSFLHWYFVRFVGASPFGHSRGFDLKTAIAQHRRVPISRAGRSRLPAHLTPEHPHTHHAADDAIAQAEIFCRLMREVGRGD